MADTNQIINEGRTGGASIAVNGTTLYYEVKGEGVPLLMLHGNGEDCSIFDELAENLKEHFCLYAIDSRNHGRSGKTEDYSYETMTEDVFALIQALKLNNVYLLGFSDGAIIGLMLAMKHGGTVAKAALLGLNLKPSDFTDESIQYIKDTYKETQDPLFKLMLSEPNIELNEIRNVAIPIFLVSAENDIFKAGSFDAIERVLPCATHKVMAGHDHASYIIHTNLLNQELITFFNSKGGNQDE